MVQPPQPDTPVGKNGRRQAVNSLASTEYAISERAIKPKEMSPYVELARSSLGDAKWEAILGDDGSAVRAALKRLVDLVEEKPDALEATFYGPTIQLCNCISLAVFDQVRDSRPTGDQDVACIFTIQADEEPKGDMLGLKHKPDYCSFSGTLEELTLAAAEPYYARSICWPEMEMIGEHKTERQNGKGQFKTYLSTLKRYRPDIPTVHGFLVYRRRIQLSQLNACGMWSSNIVGIDHLDTWVAFVVLLYQSYQHRDRKLVYNAQQTEFSRWDFVDTPEQPPLVLIPFYAASAPGRVTFASFEVPSGPVELPKVAEAFYGPEVEGFWKTSWQQEGRRSEERKLLDRLHAGDRWLPGLVRPYPELRGKRLRVPTADDMARRVQNATQREVAEVEALVLEDIDVDIASSDYTTAESGTSSDRTSNFSFADEDDGDSGAIGGNDNDNEGLDDFAAFLTSMPASPPDFVGRVQEILRLGSIGEPLSQCESPRHLLFCAYDLLETHIHMWEEGVLHRDVSWFNVLCNPRHHIGDEADAKDRPCIKKILYALGEEAASHPEDNAPVDLMPCALLTDLDHAIDRKHLETSAPAKDDGDQTERKDDGRRRTGTAMFLSWELSDHTASTYQCLSNQIWVAISKALNYVAEHEHGPAALSRAFPDDHGGFLDSFNQVKALELERDDYAPLPEPPRHSPRHDAESIYWVFLWAFARAKPRAAAEEPTDSARAKKLASFANSLLNHSVENEEGRLDYLTNREKLAGLFHPDLAAFEELLRGMAAYLAVPWHLYGHIIKDDHVHVAFRRMILGYVLQTDPDLLDILLDTERPRPVKAEKGMTTERLTPAWSASLTAVGASGRASFQDPLPVGADKKPKGAKAGAGRAGPSSLPQARAPTAPAEPTTSTSSTGSNKRKVGDTDGQPATKRSRTGKAKKPSLPEQARQATCYIHELHLRDRSAHALRLKALKDRMYWFSKGY